MTALVRDLMPIAGAGGGGGKGGGSGGSSAPVEAPDSLRSIQYARVINLICEGEVEGIVGGAQGIFVDDTRLQNADGTWNFSGAAVEWRSGTASQQPIAGFSATESESSVGVAVTAAAPVVRSITNPNMTSFRITLGFNALTTLDPTNGNLSGASVTLGIDVQRNGGGFARIYTDTVDGKTTSRYQRSYRIDLMSRFGTIGGTFDFRVVRVTPDATSVNVTDKFQWETMTEIVDSQLIYPYSALAGVQIDASTFKAIPKLAFDIKMRRIQVPSNYDPTTRAYTGIWDGTFKIAWSDNPAWVVYDLVTTARFGLGNYLSAALVDKWTLYTIAQYCDALVPDGFGGMEPRYTCNVYVQARSEAIGLLQQFASIFNGLLFWTGGALTFAADMPADTTVVYGRSNIIDGVFNYVGTPLNQRHTTALITWNDPGNKYQQAIEYVEDQEGVTRWGVRALEVQAFGCTSRGQAHRIGNWALLSERLLGETVTFRTGMNAAFSRPGDVFATTDETRAGLRMSGRVMSATASTIRIDAPITVGIAQFSVMLPNGTFETRTTTNAYGSTDTVTVNPPFSVAPTRGSVWSYQSSDLVNEQWRCVGVTEDDDGNVEISGIAYRPDKFAAIELGLQLQPLPTSIIDPFNVGPCTELKVKESKYQMSPVVVAARATFSWLAPLGAVRFNVLYQKGSDAPVYIQSGMPSIDVQPTEEGQWTFTVWAINAIGVTSPPATIVVQLRALNQPPGDVKGFQLDIYNDSAQLGWLPATDLDVMVGGQVHIRYSTRLTTAVTWEEASPIAQFAGSQTSGFVALMKGTYLAKFRNSSGAFSTNAAYIISTTGPLRDYNLVVDMAQQPTFTGTKVNCEVRTGVLYLSQNADRTAVALHAEYYFMPKFIDLAKVYTIRCSAYMEGAVYGLLDDVDSWPDFDARLDVDGSKIDEGGAMVMVSTTNKDPATAAEADWSTYKRLVVSDLTFRAARFMLQEVVPDLTTGMGIITLGVKVDVPDRIESRNNVAIAAAGTTIKFTVPFKDAPAISIIAQGLASGDKWTITGQSATGFTIAFQNSAGTAIAKTCDWIARGYGYEHVALAGLGQQDLERADLDVLIAQRAAIGPVMQQRNELGDWL
ncbi:host specificity protein J [Caballeronia pedi]|uniref:Host specificity protein J n=1 Tax=Caballeronia pedi TaxID=1777141 RepID=A0A158B089_9BURK|nr:phage tail protein [Caballeronia pedi]SAK63648.1 host specificity protein J [Caballeronia pedi]